MKRFNLTCYDCDPEVREEVNGPWVRFGEADALRARAAELEAALKKYGGHMPGCAYDESDYNDGPWPCDCGFQAIKETLP